MSDELAMRRHDDPKEPSVPPDQQPEVPVEEPPDPPVTEPNAPVREPGPTPPKRLQHELPQRDLHCYLAEETCFVSESQDLACTLCAD